MDDREADLDDPRWRERVDGDTDADGTTVGTEPGEFEPATSPDPDDADPVEVGVALLSRLEHEALSVADAIDRIEAVTTSPERQREILETAERRGLVERTEGSLRPTGGRAPVSLDREVVVRHGEFTCQRCGASIGEGHFVRLDPGEVGPYGSTCIRSVLGRD